MPDRKFRNGHGKPVIALDIDGTLGDYHGWFLKFAEMYFGRPMPDPQQINFQKLHAFIGVSQTEYREAKLAYRQGGWKRGMPCYPGAAYLTAELRANGAEVWICTTRPYLRLDNVDPDTREWLRRNEIEYDAVLFDGLERNKYEELVEQVGRERIVAIVDDLPEQILNAKAAGIDKRYLRDQPYNRLYIAPMTRRLGGCRPLLNYLLADIEEWRAS